MSTPRTSIDEGRFIEIGGARHWVTIRGQDRANPVLLFLHGPGFAYSPFAPIYAPWEETFTLVQWDQPGAGATFARNGPLAPMTLDRIARDGVALAEILRSQLGVRQVVLMATSGGSAIGLKMIKARPDLFSAYVGNGQIVDWVKQEARAYAMILNRAKQAGDEEAIAEIEGIGPPPWTDVADVAAKAKYANAMTGRERDAFAKLPVAAVGAPPADATWVARGLPRVDPVAISTATYEALRGEIESFDARALGLRYDVPIVILQGAEDAHTVTSEVTAWFGEIHAPSKVLSILPDAGHMSIFLVDELKARLDRHVRPLALSTAAGS